MCKDLLSPDLPGFDVLSLGYFWKIEGEKKQSFFKQIVGSCQLLSMWQPAVGAQGPKGVNSYLPCSPGDLGDQPCWAGGKPEPQPPGCCALWRKGPGHLFCCVDSWGQNFQLCRYAQKSSSGNFPAPQTQTRKFRSHSWPHKLFILWR